MTGTQLRRLQWAVRATLALGVAASVTANILHARPHPISQAIAAWPPLALLITVELVSRIPVHRRALGAVRITSTAAIAGIAAWVSYGHMVEVVARYGETGTVPYLLPLSVDGLIVVASVSLIELAARRRDTASRAVSTAEPDAHTRSSTAPFGPRPIPASTPPPIETYRAGPDSSGDVLRRRAQPGTAIGEPGARPPAGPTTPQKTAPLERPAYRHEVEPAAEARHSDTAHSSNRDSSPHTNEFAPDKPSSSELSADREPLLTAARTAREELIREGRPISRDALARRMRRNGHSIRNERVSELLAALRPEPPPLNVTRQPAAANSKRPPPN